MQSSLHIYRIGERLYIDIQKYIKYTDNIFATIFIIKGGFGNFFTACGE